MQVFFESNCPRLMCKDCAIKNSDIATKQKRRKGVCEFYAEHPDGYAGGYVLEGKEYKLIKHMDCPREFVWCDDCSKACKKRNQASVVTSLDYE